MSESLDPSRMHWMRKPSMYMVEENRLIIETEPHTSFRSLYYDSTDAFGMTLDPMYSFCFTVRMDFAFRTKSDECGILIRRNDAHWAKAGLERREDDLDLFCTVYSDGYGDRSCRTVGQGIRWLYLRSLFWAGNVRFQYSFNGTSYSDMRWLHFSSSETMITPGVYACSPGDSYFDCAFSEMELREI